MDAMLKLVTDNDLKPEQISACASAPARTSSKPLRYKTAKTELEAKFCLPFMMSSIILRRKAGIREFTDEFVVGAGAADDGARDTLLDREIEARGFDKMRSIVEVGLTDGRTLTQPSDDRYRGGPERPFTRDELHEKFADCASLVLTPERRAGRSS